MPRGTRLEKNRLSCEFANSKKKKKTVGINNKLTRAYYKHTRTPHSRVFNTHGMQYNFKSESVYDRSKERLLFFFFTHSIRVTAYV